MCKEEGILWRKKYVGSYISPIEYCCMCLIGGGGGDGVQNGFIDKINIVAEVEIRG